MLIQLVVPSKVEPESRKENLTKFGRKSCKNVVKNWVLKNVIKTGFIDLKCCKIVRSVVRKLF